MEINWKPGEDFAIIVDDKSGEPRTDEQFNEMVDKIKKVVNEYNFDISSWGSWRCVSKQIRNEVIMDLDEILREKNLLKRE